MPAIRLSMMSVDEANRPPFGRVVDVLLDPEKIASPEDRERWLAETAAVAFSALLEINGFPGEVTCAD